MAPDVPAPPLVDVWCAKPEPLPGACPFDRWPHPGSAFAGVKIGRIEHPGLDGGDFLLNIEKGIRDFTEQSIQSLGGVRAPLPEPSAWAILSARVGLGGADRVFRRIRCICLRPPDFRHAPQLFLAPCNNWTALITVCRPQRHEHFQ